MEIIRISDIKNYEGKEVEIKGWLYNKRSSGSIKFLIIRDGTGFIQATLLKSEIKEELFNKIDTINYESSIKITGLVREEKRASSGYEILIKNVEIISMAEENYPISLKEHGVGFLMDYRHLWLRSPRQNAILRIRAEIIKSIRNFLDQNGFILIDSPILTPAACEGTTTLFETDYFGEKAYLTQSGQLYNEASAMAFGKVYCFGPTFRAEKSKTRRHLMEFWMVEPEAAYVDLEENNKIQENIVTYVVKQVLENKKMELDLLERDSSKLEIIKVPFPRISYDEAIEILKKDGSKIEWGDDFGGEDETILSQKYEKPIFIHRYPIKCKAFYMKPDPQRPEVALCADLLAPEGYGEIIGGGQRIEDYNLLANQIKEHNLPRENYEWYLDLRRYGSVPHSGFGLGIERTIAWICGLDHVRETIPFPRMLNKIYP
ncbi:MAG: asparagine--tRNA ligase [Candidatus Infernicultor aquiphilus]|uniref:Asparagine--tRNA ligase n=1 Tax=Candidatus Infernicultor aquiphilus TaxID=1805029 RepID=A0A1J5GSN4_9BACT|nr:asparagine--tRNA ligase [bacterium]OIP70008.1 MAG: asparagine--tRNA ligase [Candidatus Atribacteria bacterium CG2_30_33_13]PIU25740.1 MAG: asparagine--tRNA ligase [Candidatus Atribacteria bacterium CG08_land_8_20_14_0_20_33_29]PIW11921.1 MAG: asparagine--tRNA ligase [Candidatus Atribacteria bacterium CG17_big_fil_post_rev_8_21_14_2_50_34_11]PIX33701.1 MAG: asparagine--tRNA ligase [Candidatus Atribacteria bacterium CG_4_8_14_3_um_filter_34_18]PIY32284.1 MAG: asparagine--tRNA ligase [Candidat